jgi:hypothetical protein
MERENSVGALLPDLNKLRIDLGRDLDVEDLDDGGWKAASKEGRIVELGSLGEGAGGAVTRCILKDGKTVFALKVCFKHSKASSNNTDCTIAGHHNKPRPRRQEADRARTFIQQELRIRPHLPILRRIRR